ncbi:MAG: DNA-binding response regulator [Ardenticatenia bacterium]|nr:MAG: DNA-binding response regulator [Ardenticatenia bacterium]
MKQSHSVIAGIFAPEIVYQGLCALKYKGFQISFWEFSLNSFDSRESQIANVIIVFVPCERQVQNTFAQIVKLYHSKPILLLLPQPLTDIYHVLRMKEGPLGIALINDSLHTIARGIQTIIFEQKDWFSDQLSVSATNSFFYEESKKLYDELTEREMEVLYFLSQGLMNKEIAYHLAISERTVRFHLKNIYEKLGCSSRGEAIALINRTGYFFSDNHPNG